MEFMHSFDHVSRRSLIKLMALASPALCASASLPASPNADGSAIYPSAGGPQTRRPRLFYNANSLRRMRAMLASDANAEAALKERGEVLLAAELIPEKIAEIGGGQQANYATPGNQITEMGLTLGLLYHLTGEKRYADKLREALLYYTHYVRWAGQGLADRFPPWHSELDTTKFSFGYAAGYDALRDVLSAEDRKMPWSGWPFCPHWTIGSSPARACIPSIRWDITGGACAWQAAACARLRCWATTRARQAGSTRWMPGMCSGSTIPATCCRTACRPLNVPAHRMKG
jgi:hypothetical protein